MSDPSPAEPSSYVDDLPAAEQQVRHYGYIEDEQSRLWVRGGGPVAVLMANYDRLQAENAELRKTCDERGEIIQSVLTEMDRRGWWAYPSTLAKDVSRALDGPELGEQRAEEATQRALNRAKGQRDA